MKIEDQTIYSDLDRVPFDKHLAALSNKQAKIDERQTEKEIDATTDPRYNEIFLPSRFIPYKNKAIRVRRFVPADVAKIYAAKTSNNPAFLVDAVGATIVGVDIKRLTVGDFYFILYWHRLNSYTQSPLTVNWTSRYENVNEHEIRFSDLKVEEIGITQEDYDEWFRKGFDFPRIEDFLYTYETYGEESSENVEEKWLFSKAQYLYNEKVENKIAALNSSEDLSIVENIREWAKISTHGVVEKVKVTDKHFHNKSNEEIIEGLRKRAWVFNLIVAQDPTNDSSNIFRAQAEDYNKEALEFEEAIKAGLNIKPKEEEVALGIDATSFFPGI